MTIGLDAAALLSIATTLVLPIAAGAGIFFVVAHADRASNRASLRSHARRTGFLYLLAIFLGVYLALNGNRQGFWEFGVIVFLPFLLFLGGIFGDALFCVLDRRKRTRRGGRVPTLLVSGEIKP